jgi:hypothetical protein
MTLIEKEWQKGSKSTWIEIVAAPTGYIIQLTSRGEANFIRKNIAPLTGSEVNLLSDETVQKLICYTPKETKSVEHYTIGDLLGASDNQIPFTVNIEKLLHYHVGAFAFTGSGKSNLTSLIVRKAMHSIPNVKFVIFDISSEYGVNILQYTRVKTGYQRFPKEIEHAVTRAGPRCDPKQHLGRFVARSSLFLTRSGAAITSSPIKRYSLPG